MKYISILLISYAVLLVQLVFVPSIDLFLVGIIMSSFFYSHEDTLTFAISGGFLRDLAYPLFGYHLLMYPLIGVACIALIQTIITHRTLWGFIVFSIVILCSAALVKYAFSIFALMLFHQNALMSIGIQQVVYVVSSGMSSFALCILSFALLDRVHHTRRYGIVIERV